MCKCVSVFVCLVCLHFFGLEHHWDIFHLPVRFSSSISANRFHLFTQMSALIVFVVCKHFSPRTCFYNEPCCAKKTNNNNNTSNSSSSSEKKCRSQTIAKESDAWEQISFCRLHWGQTTNVTHVEHKMIHW